MIVRVKITTWKGTSLPPKLTGDVGLKVGERSGLADGDVDGCYVSTKTNGIATCEHQLSGVKDFVSTR